ncbi:MAG: SPFH domain-containing protein [Thermoplasmata archaeon]|jgi:membrane protease subunit (stomatin/prohibitin family)|nr:SPFH domain-containing protein [Thermoplasmata archaeon]MBE6523900.1 SPFH domain-containing protein [Thermoplasmata archaeon]
MGLFKNKNESAYDNKKTFLSVIKSDNNAGSYGAMSADDVFWKVPFEDFNIHSKLIVGESEDALFYKNGVVLEVFSGGEYDLETNNYPFLSRIRNMLSNGISIYNARVYYINKAHKLDNRWGTDSPIQVVDKKYNIATSVQARGAYTLQIVDSKKFFLKFVGLNQNRLTATDVISEFRAPVSQKIKSLLGNVIKSMDDEIIGICSRQDEVAEMVKPMLDPIFDEYGIRLVNFYVEALDVANDESRRVLEEARTKRATTQIEAEGEKARLETLGITWAQSESASIMHDAAQNEGSGMVGAGVGIGFGLAAGSGMYNMAASTMTPLDGSGQQQQAQQQQPQNPGTVKCSCGAVLPAGSKFCSQCGQKLNLFCPNCGNKLLPGVKFCSECGSKIE